ncbi:MAG: hypothetical protein A2W61_02445 [Deltaproteobacteria bacterium RIFCSPLOWO2_01_44_7]|nr:MAG: hypothetical protein A2712_00715 [Deltaproteobacteria bacterium RIFCSPHIGHO2_01_FULL_43_49]OGQ14204.1 MAG: hypothetical protein A3D22_09895 [Deltaproteobacteria bacterium RIFCSPHIGHO2_02_FULL_44_53]OGQ27420.1 MAG: hypothetical protein A3D98_03495 [Deltaproteobacteria bacterium RIFCSPHIGHO2_12_FULL_44_21]OGQ30668.1 MAG: hypothetical protein A2979_05920 [Deltaproteobacteria bacterium RIFCSPLOWO2_01_FULL_45_74]OGQ39452.1 MAG: hypothetical protein A2W61_02445 [Deltaproteobacteria bacterium 
MTNIRQLFSNISGTYDLLNKVLSFGTDKKWRKKGVGLLPHANHVKILDLASGTLDLSLEYTRQGAGEVYALDFSLPMLLTGHTKVSPTLDKRLHLICGDCLKLPFPTEFFDAAMCAWGMRNFSNLATSIQEIKRVLKPGGSLLVIEFFKPTKPLTKIFSKTYGRYVMPTLGRWISKNDEAYHYLHRSIQGFHSRKDYEGLLEKEGFEILQASDLTGGISSLILANSNGLSH